MDFEHPLSAFIRLYFNVSKLSGHEKALIVAALLSGGKTSTDVSVTEIRKSWSKAVLRTAYGSSYISRAQERGWLRANGKGTVHITDAGVAYLTTLQKNVLAVTATPGAQGGLMLFAAGETHSFDKKLRELMASSRSFVRIADSYVDETVFDNLLDQIPKNVRIQLLYGRAYNTFEQRAKRFAVEYPKFALKNNRNFHDRLLIIDSVGYVLGPSLKDAALKSPASVVKLSTKDSEELVKFFDGIWKDTP